jgi:hypothetical protein
MLRTFCPVKLCCSFEAHIEFDHCFCLKPVSHAMAKIFTLQQVGDGAGY